MRSSRPSSPSRSVTAVSRGSHGLHLNGLRRKLICLTLILCLIGFPLPNGSIYELKVLASSAVGLTTGTYGQLSLLLKWLLGGASGQQEETLEDRIARVWQITISPHRFVGYIGDKVTFVAMGSDASGDPVHGAKFTFESSDESKLTIDEAGQASLLQAGRVQVICWAGTTNQTVQVQIRPTRRPLQTDAEWRADQDSLVSIVSPMPESKGLVSSLLDRVVPTVHANPVPFQSGCTGCSPGDYGNAATLGQVGTPPYAALEGTRLGPVMHKTNFELPIPLVNLGGRGLATSLNLYYNSNVWGAYFDPVLNKTVMVLDPVQGWPSQGFSLGFGRIIYYDPIGSTHKFMFIAPNGTRHYLGVGNDFGSNTLKTTDGSQITYVGNAADGGTLFYKDGTAVTISKVNNRLLPTMVVETNGNYVQIAIRQTLGFRALL